MDFLTSPSLSSIEYDSQDLFAKKSRFANTQSAAFPPKNNNHNRNHRNLPRSSIPLPNSPFRELSLLPSAPLPDLAFISKQYSSVLPSALPHLITKQHTLLLDIRPPSQFDSIRIASSVPLSVPSTLLKRPRFSLARMVSMLPSSEYAEKFVQWPNAQAIIVIDADSPALLEGGNLLGLLNKFRAESFNGHLFWIKGGISTVIKEASDNPNLAKLLSSNPIMKDLSPTGSLLPRARDLPHKAFLKASTTIASHKSTKEYAQMSSGTPPSSSRVIAANPFFDNIRQLTELNQAYTERITLNLSPSTRTRLASLPIKWLRDIANRDEAEGADILAMQFYKVELAEQRRLLGIMNEHSRAFSSKNSFPFSITAGIEKGSKNRYRNIWPFEHSRVHLQCSSDEDSDYLNASFIRPPGTNKCYIATQGPLPDTYADFWSMLWQQNVTGIVMLTKRFEGSSVKCGTYWPTPEQKEMRYGSYMVTLVSSSPSASETDADLPSVNGDTGFDFEFHEAAGQTRNDPVARRMFSVVNLNAPFENPRQIWHFQYLGWPDLDVPDDPRGLLHLQKEVDSVLRSDSGPLVLHCSAGVGRTGGYILIDAVLDAIRNGLSLDAHPTSTPLDETTPANLKQVPETPILDSTLGCTPTTSFIPDFSRDDSEIFTGSQSGSGSNDPFLDSSRSDPALIKYRLRILRKKASALAKETKRSPRINADRDYVPSSKSQVGLSDGHNSSLSSTSATPTSPLFKDPSLTDTLNSNHKQTSPSSRSDRAFDFANLPPTPSDLIGVSGSRKLMQLDEPIQSVLELMREQRMSLCQTLRQYVFAHRAIIEGVFEIMDERDKSLSMPDYESPISRSSVKRRHRGDSLPQAPVSRARQG